MRMLVLQPRRPDLTHEEFSQHWRTVHAPQARRIATLQKYVQSHRSPLTDVHLVLDGIVASEFDGISEAWFTSSEDALGMTANHDYRAGPLQDEPNFLDIPRKVRLFCPETPSLVGDEQANERALMKLVLFLSESSVLPGPEGGASWTVALAEHASAVPDVARLTVTEVAKVVCVDPAVTVDHVLEMGWRDSATLEQAMRSTEMQQLIEVVEAGASAASAMVAQEERFI